MKINKQKLLLSVFFGFVFISYGQEVDQAIEVAEYQQLDEMIVMYEGLQKMQMTLVKLYEELERLKEQYDAREQMDDELKNVIALRASQYLSLKKIYEAAWQYIWNIY